MIVDTVDDAVRTKVRTAVARLSCTHPLIGYTLSGHAIRITRGNTDMYHTDGVTIVFNAAYVAKQSMADVEFDLIHEWLHIFGRDGMRRGSRDPHLWNIAADYWIITEAMRLTDRAEPSLDSLTPPAWVGKKSKEEIYATLLTRPKPEHPRVCSGSHAPLSSEQRIAMRDSIAAGTEIEARASTESMDERYGAATMSRLRAFMRETVPWERLLIGHLQGSVGPGETSWSPPNLRYFTEDIVLPRSRSRRVDVLGAFFDISGSMTDDMIRRAGGAMEGAARRARKTYVGSFDQVLRELHEVKQPTAWMKNLRFESGAHSSTNTRDVFAAIAAKRMSTAVIFTDGYVELPAQKPAGLDLIWVLIEGERTMPYGTAYCMGADV